jgi:hypothetical protein
MQTETIKIKEAMAGSEILITIKGITAFIWKLRIANLFLKLAKYFLKPIELNIVEEDDRITKLNMELIDGEYKFMVFKPCYVHTGNSNRDIKLKKGVFDCEKFKLKVGNRKPPFMYMYLLRIGLETVWFTEKTLKESSDKYCVSE